MDVQAMSVERLGHAEPIEHAADAVDTEAPEGTFAMLIHQVLKSAQLVRLVLCRVPPERGLRWSRRLVDTFLPLHKAARHNRVAQALLSRLSPVLAYYHTLPLDDDLQREWALLDTHDSLTDRYKHFRTKGQISRYLRALGAEEIWCECGGNGVEARCRRPGV